MALSKAKIDQLDEHLKQGQYANAEDMITLKELVDYEVNTRRHQNYKVTNEVPKKFGQFDTAKFINNLLGGLKKLNNRKFDLVIQNYTFIRALYEIWRKIKKLMEYEEYTKYSDNAGCDGECRGLCSSCSSSCVGGNSGKGSSSGGGIGGGTGIVYYRYITADQKGFTYWKKTSDGKYQQVDSLGNPIGSPTTIAPFTSDVEKNYQVSTPNDQNYPNIATPNCSTNGTCSSYSCSNCPIKCSSDCSNYHGCPSYCNGLCGSKVCYNYHPSLTV